MPRFLLIPANTHFSKKIEVEKEVDEGIGDEKDNKIIIQLNRAVLDFYEKEFDDVMEAENRMLLDIIKKSIAILKSENIKDRLQQLKNETKKH